MDTTDLDESGVPPAVTVATRGVISFVTLNRPDQYNAVNADVTRLLRDAIADIERSPGTRVIVLRGAGKGFCAGGDLPFFAAQGDGLRRTVDGMLDDGNRLLQALRATNKFVLASVHGAAAGAGLSLVMACDFCIAAPDAVFVPAYAKLAVSPDLGGTANMARAVGLRQAMRVFFLEDRLDAEEARRIGIVSRIAPAGQLAEATIELAQRLADLPAASSMSTKALLRQAASTDPSEQLEAERASFQDCIHGPETRAALQRFKKYQASDDSPRPATGDRTCSSQ